MRFNILSTFVIGALLISACNNKEPTPKVGDKLDSVVYLDTVSKDTLTKQFDANAQYFELAREFNLTKDSIDILKDSIDNITLRIIKEVKSRDSIALIHISTKEKLGVAEFKLLRIREYNRIAAQGNNIKFLRGWIKRVIEH